ncbi:hypothetical protein [Sphingosinicella sp.]|jgi:hypothetical protein|uniref:Uncharacterized protein n=2 Tax=Pseudomonadota TaxID=1224 RepID=A0A080M975_9PROT|nr:MAG: hypothetical protein AW09_001082 [Candidatus Accumulibacter phosphatis]MBL8647939.1 hypothetical protein [Sphingosinicella sp.]
MTVEALIPVTPPLVKSRLRTKRKAAVELVLEDGTSLAGHMFVGPDERVLECLNDARPFIPFLQSDGTMLIVAKLKIAACRPLED